LLRWSRAAPSLLSKQAFRVPVRHGECSVRDRHKRTVGFIESAMPADGIPRCGFASNGDVGTSRLEEQL
jgi:hypothetical protein